MLSVIVFLGHRNVVPQEAGCAPSCEIGKAQHFVHNRFDRHDDSTNLEAYSRALGRAAARRATTRTCA
jgi:hypothetical protein